MSRLVQGGLVGLTLLAFAANSLLNRAALVDGAIGPGSFAAIRVCAGAMTLLALAVWTGGLVRPTLQHALSAAGLSLYMLGFSFAYVSLDAGFGALLLFGGVQVTMFAGAVLLREQIPLRRWIGAMIALSGLLLLLQPTGTGGVWGMILMLLAALGWGVFSLLGRASTKPLVDTALAFALSVPIVLLAMLVVPDLQPPRGEGILLAVLSGAVTSGCGYALWYRVLPMLGASRASVAQLSVPVIAALGGVVFLSETLSMLMVVSGLLVLGGVAVSLRPGQSRGD
jgi:drug/metabolite transporter (DMT)-like permease